MENTKETPDTIEIAYLKVLEGIDTLITEYIKIDDEHSFHTLEVIKERIIDIRQA